MSDVHTLLAQLRRPRLLINAARFGVTDYRRERDLRRLLSGRADGRTESILPQLMSEERDLEGHRKTGDARYSVTRHIEIMIALLAEARLLMRRSEA